MSSVLLILYLTRSPDAIQSFPRSVAPSGEFSHDSDIIHQPQAAIINQNNLFIYFYNISRELHF